MLGELRPETGLVGLFHFENNANDSSGNGNNGTGTAISYSQANGKFGQGAGFNGSSSKILLPAVFAGFTNSFSFSGWIKPSAIASYRTIYSSDGANANWLHFDDTGSICYFVKTGGTMAEISTPMSINNWYHVGATYDGANIRLYVNGVQKASQAKTGNFNYNETSNFYVGSYTGSAHYFSGSMDELTFHNIVKPANWFRQQYSLGRFGEL